MRRDRDLDLGLVAVEQDDGCHRPGSWLVALPLPAEGTLGQTAPDRLLFEDDLVRSFGDGGVVPGGRKAALLLFRSREDEIELFASTAIVGVTTTLHDIDQNIRRSSPMDDLEIKIAITYSIPNLIGRF